MSESCCALLLTLLEFLNASPSKAANGAIKSDEVLKRLGHATRVNDENQINRPTTREKLLVIKNNKRGWKSEIDLQFTKDKNHPSRRLKVAHHTKALDKQTEATPRDENWKLEIANLIQITRLMMANRSRAVESKKITNKELKEKIESI